MAKLSVMFLQGPAGGSFVQLARALVARGHTVHPASFNAGDRMAWCARGAISFRGRPEEWPARCEQLFRDLGITDLVVFGDCRPLHRAAVSVARRCRVRVTVVEEGYLRPDWVTVEPEGVNGWSSLPRDPAWYRDNADEKLAPLPAPIPYSFAYHALVDLAYNFAIVAGAFAYPFYRNHRPWHPLAECAGWIWRLLCLPVARRRSACALARIGAARAPYFVFPLQLDCDYQLRIHSPFGGLVPAIEAVLGSFARHAPADTLLVVKQHPLDNGLTDWRSHVARRARQLGITARVAFIEAGEIGAVVQAARGVVTINSTAGMAALAVGVPVLALGNAVYDLPGLTSQCSIDAFWLSPSPPDAELFQAFRDVLIRRCLVPGGLHSRAGISRFVEGAVARLEGGMPSFRTAPRDRRAIPFAATPSFAPNIEGGLCGELVGA